MTLMMSSTVLERQHLATSLYSNFYAITFAHQLHEPTALWITTKFGKRRIVTYMLPI